MVKYIQFITLSLSASITLHGASLFAQKSELSSYPTLKITESSYCSSIAEEDSNIPLIIANELQNQSDMEKYEQLLNSYAANYNNEHIDYLEPQKNLEALYYSVWKYTTPPQNIEAASWSVRAFKSACGSNLKPLLPEWLKMMEEESNFTSYGSLNLKGCAKKRIDIRALPTDKPIYENPMLPSGGYPFDLNQNSSVDFQEPVFVSHTSKDGSWSYIFTSTVSGWVHTEDIVILDDATTQEIISYKKIVVTEDNIPLYNTNQYIGRVRIGMVLPIVKEDSNTFTIPIYIDSNNKKEIQFSKEYASAEILKLNKSNLVHIGNQMLKNTYGWGGMFGERDCSALIKEMYTPFGYVLPRNSSSQAKKGEIISFNGLTNEQKIDLIKEKGIPFETILFLKGHVMLYIGVHDGNVMVLHNIWGVRTVSKTGVKGRAIVGKAVISTLLLGSERDDFDTSMSLLNRLESMNVFTGSTLHENTTQNTVGTISPK